MNLYFRDRYGDKRLLASNLQDSDGIYQHIKRFLDDHRFQWYYTRTWYSNGYTWYDVGSHFEFFLVDANMMGIYEDEQKEEEIIYNTAQRDKRAFSYRPE